ncbi:MAG: hypothetical protein AAF383_24925 [Cyanobacteria bacterium P01_A01_bin.83]
MENDLPAESCGEERKINVFGNYNENIYGDYQAVILQRTLNLRSPYKGLKRFNARDQDLFFGRQRLKRLKPHVAIALLQTKKSEWLIFIDQFEELFTLCPNRETRSNFLQGLIDLAQDSNHSVKLILAIRSDFLQELATYTHFYQICSQNIHLVADLEDGELRQAIEQPAAQHGVILESGLAEKIIRDVRGQAGSLPLLQYTLNLLWQNEDLSDRTLNIATYHQLSDEFIDHSIEKCDRIFQRELETAPRLAQADRKAKVEAEKRATEQKKANQKLRIWSLIAVAFGMTASLLGINSYINSQESQLQGQAANIKVKLSQSNQLDRLLESIELVGQNQTFNQRRFKSKSQLVPDVQSVLYQAVKESREKHSFNDHQAFVRSVAISSDGQYLVSGSRGDNTIKFWDVEGKSVIYAFEGHQGSVNSVAISSDGQYLVSGSNDNTVKLWDAKSKSLIHTFKGHQDWVNSVAISSDGQYLVSGSNDNTVKLWDAKRKSLIHTFKGHQDWVNSVAISSDGQYLVSGSDDNTVKLWDVKSKSLIHTFKGHQGSVNSVAISNDGQYLVSGSNDNTVKLWDIKGKSLIHTFKGHQGSVNSVAISSDGQYLVSGSNDNTVKF